MPEVLDSKTTTAASPLKVVRVAAKAVQKYHQEVRKNDEVVEQLHKLHTKVVEASELRKKYKDLLQAHEMLSELMAKNEKEVSKARALKDTVKGLEGVILKLEGLLAKTVTDGQVLASLKEDNERLAKRTSREPSCDRR